MQLIFHTARSLASILNLMLLMDDIHEWTKKTILYLRFYNHTPHVLLESWQLSEYNETNDANYLHSIVQNCICNWHVYNSSYSRAII